MTWQGKRRKQLALSILRKILTENCASMGPHPPDTTPSEAASWPLGLLLDCSADLTEDEWRLVLAIEAERGEDG